MKNKLFAFLTIVLASNSVNAQNKSGTTTVSPNRHVLTKPNQPQRPSPPAAKPATPQGDVAKASEIAKTKRNTEQSRAAARLGVDRHREIQSKLATDKKGRQAEVKFSDVKTRKVMRADVRTKRGRMFEIKPDTKSGRSPRSKNQLRKYEEASLKRGGMIYYEPQTGKYRFERTPYKEWVKRKQLLPATEKVKRQKLGPNRPQRPRIRY